MSFNKKQKGQVFALDYMLAIVAMFFILSYIFAFFELNAYNQKDVAIDSELRVIAENAADILATHPKYTCELENSDIKLANCTFRTTITKEDLGIPDDYRCNINIPDAVDNECEDDPNTADLSLTRVYSASRFIVYAGSSQEVARRTLKGFSANTQGSLEVKVWR